MTKAEIFQSLGLVKRDVDMILRYCIDTEFAVHACRVNGEKTVAESLSFYCDAAKRLQTCIDALLTEHGDEDMIDFADKDIEG